MIIYDREGNLGSKKLYEAHATQIIDMKKTFVDVFFCPNGLDWIWRILRYTENVMDACLLLCLAGGVNLFEILAS